MSNSDKRLLFLVTLLSVVCFCLKIRVDNMYSNVNKSNEKNTYLGDNVSLEKDAYSCKPGETIYTYFMHGAEDSLKSIASGNRFVAGITKMDSSEYKRPLCISCDPVKITCRLKGTTNVSLNTKDGQRVTAKVIVSKDPGYIKFNDYNLRCTAGQKFSLNISASPNTKIKSYSVDDTSIAEVRKSDVQLDCRNCKRVDVICKKRGFTKLRATSSSGVTTSASLSVNSSATISSNVVFEKSSITCKKGDVVRTLIKSTDGKTRIKSFYSDDIATATMALSSSQPKDPGAIQVDVICRGSGTAVLFASNVNGAVGRAKINVHY